MVDATEPPAGDASDRPEATAPPRSTARKLDRRTVAICAVIGLIAALVTGLVLSTISSDGSSASGQDGMELNQPVDVEKVLSQAAETPDEAPTTLGALQEAGKPMLVNFWQASCGPCVEEMPLLEQAQADNPDVTFVGVHTLDRLSDAKKLAKQTGITYPWIHDPSGDIYYDAQGAGMPTTVVITPDGGIAGHKTGYFKSAEELQSFIDEHTG